MNKSLLQLVENKRKSLYNNPRSIIREYTAFLESRGIYYSLNRAVFERSIKNKYELSSGILTIFHKATLDNERIALIRDLAVSGYDRNLIIELILKQFWMIPRPSNLWEYSDMLYSLQDYSFLSEYITIVSDSSFGRARQMLILLLGKSKSEEILPILIKLTDDRTVYGHALEALSNFRGERIDKIMEKYIACETKWVRDIANEYLNHRTET